jgi:hypothetical protein
MGCRRAVSDARLTGEGDAKRDRSCFLSGGGVVGETGGCACGSGALQLLVLGGAQVGERPSQPGKREH